MKKTIPRNLIVGAGKPLPCILRNISVKHMINDMNTLTDGFYRRKVRSKMFARQNSELTFH